MEKLYQNENPTIQSQMCQLFESLKSHASEILINISKVMKNTILEWQKADISIYQSILSTLPIKDVEYCYEVIMNDVMEDLENLGQVRTAVIQMSRNTTVESVNKIIKKIFEKMIDCTNNNNTLNVNKEMVMIYCDLIENILCYRVDFISPNWEILKLIIDTGLKNEEKDIKDSALNILQVIKYVFHHCVSSDYNMRNIKDKKIGYTTNEVENIKINLINNNNNYDKVIEDIVSHYIKPQMEKIKKLISEKSHDKNEWVDCLDIISSSFFIDINTILLNNCKEYEIFNKLMIVYPNMKNLVTELYNLLHQVYVFINSCNNLSEQILKSVEDIGIIVHIQQLVVANYNINSCVLNRKNYIISRYQYQVDRYILNKSNVIKPYPFYSLFDWNVICGKRFYKVYVKSSSFCSLYLQLYIIIIIFSYCCFIL